MGIYLLNILSMDCLFYGIILLWSIHSMDCLFYGIIILWSIYSMDYSSIISVLCFKFAVEKRPY